MSPQEKCILISGAGPVGLSLALMLKQMDIPFRIIERRTEASTYSRAFAIQSRTLEILKQLNVLEDIKSRGRCNVFSNNVYNNGVYSFSIVLPPGESSEPYTVGLRQSKTEEVLINKLSELGVDIEKGVELQSIQKSGDMVEYVEVKNSKGDAEKIYTDTLIGCDGSRSKVRELSGIRFLGENELLRITCVDVRVETELSGGKFASMFFRDARALLIIWIDDVTARLVIPNLPDEEDLDLEKSLEIVRKNLNPIELKILETTWFNTFKINERCAEHHNLGNIYLCGDAAHTHSPAGGQGMNTGIQDAYNLAWKIAYIHKGLGVPKVLGNNFHEERSAVAKMVLKNSGAMSRNIFSPVGPLKSLIIHNLFPIMLSFKFFTQQNANMLAEVLIKYEQNDLIRDTNAGWFYNTRIPGVGFRMPPYEVFGLRPSRLQNIHQVLNGGHCFELFLYIPESFLKKEKLDELRSTISLSSTSPTLLRFNHKSKSSQPFHQVNLIVATEMFQPDQWAYQLNDPSADKVQRIFNSTKTYLDLNREIGDYFKFSQKHISMFILRPDAVVGLAVSTTPERCQYDIESYFGRFILSD